MHISEERFFALDVETANSWQGSICQIGLVEWSGGAIQREWNMLLDPGVPFSSFNVGIHGITENVVIGKPSFREVWPALQEEIANFPVIHHGHFDKTAISSACSGANLQTPELDWLDSTKIVRRFWPQFARKGYGLKNVANLLGLEFVHHDALADAATTAQIIHHVILESGESLEWWRSRIRHSINKAPADTPICTNSRISMKPTAEGSLSGEVLLFTGELSESRSTLTARAAALGADVVGGMSKKVTVLVVGVQNPAVVAEDGKSTKQRKAEAAYSSGQEITFLDEEAFLSLLEVNHAH